MTIEDFLRLLLRHAVLIVVVTVVGAVAGLGFSFTRPEVYSASALGYVSSSSQTDDSGNPVTQASGNMEFQYSKAQSYLPLFGTRAVGQTVVDELDLDQSPDAVAGSLQTTIDPNAPIITVTATASSPQEASDIADAAVTATAKEAKSLESGGDAKANVSVQLVPYQNALVPGAPDSPDRRKYLAIGAAVGLVIALAAAWIRDRNDSRIRTAQDVENAVDVPLLGTLPEAKDLGRAKDGVLREPRSFAPREAVRKLRTNLRYVDVDSPPRSIVVTSTAPGEGKSTVSANLARVMARAGQPTLLIDADLRRPMVDKEFEVDGSVGLAQVLASAASLDDAVQPTGTDRFSVLPSGQVPPNPSELLGSRRMKDLIADLSREYFVVIDAPPVLAVTDAQLLARHADGAIVVTVPGRTRAAALTRSAHALRSIGAKVYGVVMNRASSSRFSRLAYGDAEYGYDAPSASYGYGYAGKRGEGYATVEPETGVVDVEAAGGPADPLNTRAGAARARGADGERTAATGAEGEHAGEVRRRGRRAAEADAAGTAGTTGADNPPSSTDQGRP
ncbi:polysaccharide biosynthesis tyrosine autokinase [Brachybacterium halotolerans subsp. kimchii]|uniref:polysaccharide biosynthesis tyrosine autokinase n=1 Tax=Brachybacterium halotolerans TaxID=2795215 RepID=UPI001E5020C1|nr:polysaccharide biosynthesis tyrosine autokinase [Brachybacterium halotolerans]UEJ81139.1 polysaccharide biosynthesis tyrosine autokinase [Brachybacterium halotolerans subsp. kimchii]